MKRFQLLFFSTLLVAAFSLTAQSGCSAEEPPSEEEACNGVEDCEEDPEEPDPEDSEDPCTFNEDCVDTERCVCDLVEGCFCRFGVRGTGQSGVDACVDGNDCETALCVEGWGDAYYCSGTCAGPDDCGPELPVCSNIAFLGQICIRDPNG